MATYKVKAYIEYEIEADDEDEAIALGNSWRDADK